MPAANDPNSIPINRGNGPFKPDNEDSSTLTLSICRQAAEMFKAKENTEAAGLFEKLAEDIENAFKKWNEEFHGLNAPPDWDENTYIATPYSTHLAYKYLSNKAKEKVQEHESLHLKHSQKSRETKKAYELRICRMQGETKEVESTTKKAINYFAISSILERNLSKTSKLLRTFRPRRPETVLRGGRLRQAAFMFLSSNSKNLILGMIITGTYSVLLAVIISILLSGFEGSQPIAKAISVGTVVMLAPVSKTILTMRGLRFPFRSMSRTITPVFISRGSLAISKLKNYGITFGKFVFGIVD